MIITQIDVEFPYQDALNKYKISKIRLSAKIESTDDIEEVFLSLKDQCDKLYGSTVTKIVIHEQRSIEVEEKQDLPF